MARKARSRSAEGVTMVAALPPNSNSERPKRAATAVPTARPMRVLPVAETRATRGSLTRASPSAANQQCRQAFGRRRKIPDRFAQQRFSNKGGQRRFFRRLPQNRIAADQG